VIIFKVIQTICFEPEFLVKERITVMSPRHVLICHRDRDNEIDIEMVYHIGDQTHRYNETGVFKVGKLDIHCSKFNSPSDLGSL
jgi:hypothetical protein